MDLLEIRKKAKAQKAEAKAARGKQAEADAVKVDTAAPLPAVGGPEPRRPSDREAELAPEPPPQEPPPPVKAPAAESASPQDETIAHDFEAFLSGHGRQKDDVGPRSHAPDTAKADLDLNALAEEHGHLAEELPAKGQGLDSLFLDLATEELYRHSYLTDEAAVDEAQVEVLCCTLGGEQYGINIHRIKEIIKNRDVTEVPRAPRSIVGIITLRGRVIPVFDLRERLRLTREKLGREAKIVVVHHRQEFFGLVVDAVIDVYRFPESKVEPTPPVMAGVEAKYITGIGRVDETMIIMLNLDEVLNVDYLAA